jgi:hypothetical protein
VRLVFLKDLIAARQFLRENQKTSNEEVAASKILLLDDSGTRKIPIFNSPIEASKVIPNRGAIKKLDEFFAALTSKLENPNPKINHRPTIEIIVQKLDRKKYMLLTLC